MSMFIYYIMYINTLYDTSVQVNCGVLCFVLFVLFCFVLFVCLLAACLLACLLACFFASLLSLLASLRLLASLLALLACLLLFVCLFVVCCLFVLFCSVLFWFVVFSLFDECFDIWFLLLLAVLVSYSCCCSFETGNMLQTRRVELHPIQLVRIHGERGQQSWKKGHM